MSHGGPTDPSHDEALRRGILHTSVSRPLAWAVAVVFLVIVYGVPVSQAVLEKAKDEDSMLLDVFKHAPTKQSLRQYEEDLEKASYAKDWVQPRVQYALSRLGGAGNKKAVIGRGGWLFYQPGVMSVAGPGFLDEAANQTRVKAALDDGGEPIHPDPRPAILEFHRALAARGIALILFPVPDKASLQPQELHGRARLASGPPARNHDHRRLVDQLTAAGVSVFDPTPTHLISSDAPRFLVQDTHWTPQWMESVAGELAAFIRARHVLPAQQRPRWTVAPQTVSRIGDIVDMLKLLDGQAHFAAQSINVRQVQDAEGKPWQPREDADVLLLGDSFTNVFSLAQMGWGEAAGLAPHLALALGRDVDVIAQNDSGAFATRQTLSRALGAGEDRLAGKRVVVWELASRELAVGDWKPVPWVLGKGQP